MMRMSVDLPAPLGPSNPNMPCGMASETSSSARVPFVYVLERFSMRSSMDSPEDLQSQEQHRARRHLAARKRGTRDVGGETRRSALDEVARSSDDLVLGCVQRARLVMQVRIPT